MAFSFINYLSFYNKLCGQIGITIANMSVLKTGKAKAIRFSTLEAICEILECQPGDILEYMPHKEYKKLMKLK